MGRRWLQLGGWVGVVGVGCHIGMLLVVVGVGIRGGSGEGIVRVVGVIVAVVAVALHVLQCVHIGCVVIVCKCVIGVAVVCIATGCVGVVGVRIAWCCSGGAGSSGRQLGTCIVSLWFRRAHVCGLVAVLVPPIPSTRRCHASPHSRILYTIKLFSLSQHTEQRAGWRWRGRR
jgi:hypothetical protein